MAHSVPVRVPAVDAATAHELVSAGAARVLDVRENDEWQAGHIAGSHNIPMAHLGGRLREVDRQSPWLAICRSGSVSERATDFLREAGFDIRTVTGGIRAWEAQGLPVQMADGAAGTVV